MPPWWVLTPGCYNRCVTEQELQQQRAGIWRVNGNPIRTIDDAHSFLDAVGFCLMYPVRALPMLPIFMGAYAGSLDRLPDSRHAFADPRTQPAIDLMVRLLRERHAYELNLLPESSLLVSAQYFPFFYALIGDRSLKTAGKVNAQVSKRSPLAVKIFETIERQGPVSKPQLQEALGREPSAAALDRALNDLWSILKITRVDYREPQGAYWDLLFRWARGPVTDAAKISLPEAISALLGKYLEASVAARQEDAEEFLSHLVPRSKIREAIHALLAARELNFITIGAKTLLHLPPAVDQRRPIHG